MATRVKVTYVAMNKDGNKPIMSAATFEDLRKGLDEYYSVDKTDAECLGFTTYESKYGDEYEGYYKYKWYMLIHDKLEEYIDEIKVYCVEFYPYTVYEINN